MSEMQVRGQHPPAGERDGNWVWDGSRWICSPCDCDDQRPMPCPPGPSGCPPWYDPPQAPWYPGANGGVTFSTTQPNNPIRGHFWWNGVSLFMFDGAAWVAIGPSA
jgi:hypothetical protein